MKVGDTVEVTIAGQTVAQAKVTEMGTDRATLVIPGTVVVMGVRTEIAPSAPEPTPEVAVEHQVLGVEQAAPAAPVEPPPAPVQQTAEPTPVEQPTPVAEPVAEPVANGANPEHNTAAVDGDMAE